jgi:arginine decarboxylase
MTMIITDGSSKLGMKALLVHRDLNPRGTGMQIMDRLQEELKENDVEVVVATNAFDAEMLIYADPMLQTLILDWDVEDNQTHNPAKHIIDTLRNRNTSMPIFLFGDTESASDIPLEYLRQVNDFLWPFEDTADFIAGRVVAAISRYRKRLLPPMFNALEEFSRVHEYSWHTPGHTGGTAFMKSPAGRAFFDFFGENLFRSDLSISVGGLGSLLDHSGPIGEGEKYAAKVFGADRTYCVTNGSSTSNRIIFMACVAKNQIALCDRNCHKSIEQALTMTGAIPNYLLPTRNRYGIIGPIPPERLTKTALQKAIGQNALVTKGVDPQPVHAIITNSTYDGLCYNVKRVEELLGESVDRLHFDEAWYGYARFNPLYKDRFAMHGDPKARDAKKDMTIFATQSTHKLLAALSQASFIHVRDGKKAISHARFNEAFMMHASTSPNYAIIASNDVTAAMMDGQGGRTLTDESLHEAVEFRKLVAKTHAVYTADKDWFFDVWQPDTVTVKGKKMPFFKVDDDYLCTHSEAWVLKPDDNWHGFGNIEDGYCMLDPIKVSVVTPGMGLKGMEKHGIPAAILSKYLESRGIVAEKTTDFMVLFLFSIGITKGKWGTLMNAMLHFKKDYDQNTLLEMCLHDLVETTAGRYAEMGLKDLCNEMFEAMKALKTTHYLAAGFSVLPHPDMTPAAAYEQLVLDHIKKVDLKGMANQTLATGIVPYPPGIPLLMPGENAGSADGALIGYLKSLEAFDQKFPGFTHDSHGIEVEDGKYFVYVIDKKK